MKKILQIVGRGFEPVGTENNSLDRCSERLKGDHGSPSLLFRPSVESMTELEYKGLMEERYGILDEGIF